MTEKWSVMERKTTPMGMRYWSNSLRDVGVKTFDSPEAAAKWLEDFKRKNSLQEERQFKVVKM